MSKAKDPHALVWETVDAKRILKRVEHLLEQAEQNLEGDNFDRDFVLGCVSAAHSLAAGRTK